ncbi:MAG: hypothetical protein RBR68_15145, partial [Tenuifilaceae bacterium]|nr:hypothetical protein [Tenuifilaceae bacterium]
QTLGKKAFLASNKTELQSQFELIRSKYDISKTFTQELIPFDGTNKTISYTAFCVNGEVKAHWAGVKLREHPVQFGTATFAQSVYVGECHKQSVILLKELNYTGVCEVEYLKDPRDGKYKLIEINPRTWLWVGLAKACGVDYAKIIYDYSNGTLIDYPEEYKTDMYWVNPFSDLVFSLVAILKGKLSPAAYLKSAFRYEKVNALFVRGDIKPGIMYFTKVFSFLRNR